MPNIGRYQLLEKLGQGGMGIVYRAHDTLLERIVAVKVISAGIGDDPEPRERFFREARAAGQLSHKNIITIHDLGEHEGQPYLAMEYLTGQDLAARMATPPRISLRRKLEIATEICEGLEYAHNRGVVHRDIKPGNIFVTDGGTVKIVDFGLARLVTSDLTRSNMMMGTVNYMAPEQIRGERVDHRADIFSTGVVLYELLCGRRAFEGDSFATTLYKILEIAPEPLQNIDATLPFEIVQFVDRALAKARDERYQHMSDLLRDLLVYRQQFSIDSPPGSRSAFSGVRPPSDVPTQATPLPGGSMAAQSTPGSNAAVQTPVPGRRLLLISVVAVAVLVLAVAGVSMWMASRPVQSPNADVRPTSGVRAEPPVSELMEKALTAFQSEDFAAAERGAGAVLARDPGHEAARQLRDRARTAAAAVESGLQKARTLFDAGKFEEASRAAGEVLSVAPGNQDAKRIMEEGVARSRGRGAQEARAQLAHAKAGARAAQAQRLAPAAYAAAAAAERDAERQAAAGRLETATVKFYEASGLFRSAEIAAEHESATREAQARAQKAPAEPVKKGEAETSPPASPTPSERTEKPERPEKPEQPERSEKPEKPETVPVPAPTPSTPAVTSLPAPAAPPPPAPAPEPPPPNPEVAIHELLARYKSALESRNLDALKRLWPSLSGGPQDRIRDEFQHASRISVEIIDPRISVSGAGATVSFIRRYELLTLEGQQLHTASRTTMDVRRAGTAWVIERIRFDPIR
jgi:serine/threonine protein kinase